MTDPKRAGVGSGTLGSTLELLFTRDIHAIRILGYAKPFTEVFVQPCRFIPSPCSTLSRRFGSFTGFFTVNTSGLHIGYIREIPPLTFNSLPRACMSVVRTPAITFACCCPHNQVCLAVFSLAAATVFTLGRRAGGLVWVGRQWDAPTALAASSAKRLAAAAPCFSATSLSTDTKRADIGSGTLRSTVRQFLPRDTHAVRILGCAKPFTEVVVKVVPVHNFPCSIFFRRLGSFTGFFTVHVSGFHIGYIGDNPAVHVEGLRLAQFGTLSPVDQKYVIYGVRDAVVYVCRAEVLLSQDLIHEVVADPQVTDSQWCRRSSTAGCAVGAGAPTATAAAGTGTALARPHFRGADAGTTMAVATLVAGDFQRSNLPPCIGVKQRSHPHGVCLFLIPRSASLLVSFC